MESNDDLEKLSKEEKQNPTSVDDFMKALEELMSVYREVVNVLGVMEEQENKKKHPKINPSA
ncbi:MAG: hypothetical protein KA146_04475 [Leptospiraceae bacterium]|nr:hypothetical protein [Leptospiraceae bacterium]